MTRLYSSRAVIVRSMLVSLLFLLAVIHCSNKVAGTVDDTDTGRVALLYTADGTPAANATVKAYNCTDNTIAFETTTGANGDYSLASLDGTYSIWAEKDSLVAYQDSVFIQRSNRNIVSDTLKPPGVIVGRTELETGDPQTAVIVHALGTYLFANVVDNGMFTLTGLAEGEYTLRLSCSIPGYTTTYSRPVSVRSGSTTTLETPIKMLYNGIPYVTGLQGAYDTLNGVIHLKWDRSQYANIQDYLVYKRVGDEFSYSFFRYQATKDTFYSEPVGFTTADSATDTYQYKVVIRDKFENEGRAFGHLEIVTCPPESVFTYTIFNNGRPVVTLVGTEIPVTLDVRNPTRNLRKITWIDKATQRILKEANMAGTVLKYTDTLRYTPAVPGSTVISTQIMDGGGTIWRDSVVVAGKNAYVALTEDSTPITGIHPLRIYAVNSIRTVTLDMAGITSAILPIVNGTARCTLDTRTIHPPQMANLILKTDSGYLDTAVVRIENTDPLIGTWISTPDSLVTETYFDDGRIESNRGYAWLLGWERHGERIHILQATSNPVIFIPSFTDYAHCTINGSNFVRKK